jgi:hypothetical protein
MPILFITLVILSLVLKFYLSKSSQVNKNASKEFWDKESQSNSTRKADISKLEYIKVPLDSLPFTNSTEEELVNIQTVIQDISKKPILNLTGISNTDLKFKYGAANITFLSECDNNYTLLVRNLYKWGAYLTEHDRKGDAITVLEYAIQCKTDVSKNYILLANLYKEMHREDKINDLLLTAMTLDSLMKDTIINDLKEIE